jgi:hypothetical protein
MHRYLAETIFTAKQKKYFIMITKDKWVGIPTELGRKRRRW